MLKLVISPTSFNLIAMLFVDKFKQCLLLAIAFFAAFFVLQNLQPFSNNNLSIWLPTFAILAAIECLIFAAFIAFFKQLHSHLTKNPAAIRFYQTKEWLEVFIFTLLLPLPLLISTMILIKAIRAAYLG
mgnify:CR=1 FL=1